ncbi:uncharacterized protein LOC129585837 [Paramacrobiotus metropolitanus]|uniref:uncharacterized protein LOC129585837 n=1 Tax=Paramacrobiotus metropolitanus TaxID=2943436 RepID=UPI0024460C8B|nr:uncharacterized protein LOC129585837 [Paramacrobiotus metropolitanus]
MLHKKVSRLLMSSVLARVAEKAIPENLCPCCRGIPAVASRLSSTLESTSAPEAAKSETGRAATPKKSAKLLKVSAYLSGNQPLNEAIHIYRRSLTAAKTRPPEMYVIFETLAESVIQHMDLPADPSTVYMEANPGLGLVTRRAMEKGIHRARIFEGNPVFLKRLQDIQADYGADRLEVACPFNVIEFRQRGKIKKEFKKADLFANSEACTIPGSSDSPAVDPWESKVERMVAVGLPTRPWTDVAPALKFFGIIPEVSHAVFLRTLVYSMARRNAFCSIGRPEFYLIVSPALYHTIVGQPGTNFKCYRFTTVALQTFFEILPLEEVPRNKLVPPPSLKTQNVHDNWKLIRLTARREQVLDWSLIPEYVFFLRQALMNRTRPLLVWLEGWIPGSARRLLDIGYTMYIRTGDVSATNYVNVFRLLYNAPEYSTSNFKIAFASMGDRFSLDLSENEEDNADDDDLNAVPFRKLLSGSGSESSVVLYCITMDVDDLEQGLLSAFRSMNTTDRNELITQFQALIGQNVNRGTCEFFLDMNNWNLQQSICSYYDLENSQEHLPQMVFVQDVTIGEGESVPPKTKFIKTWKIRNPGWDSWPPGCALRFTGNGHQMTHIERIALPSLKPGDTFDASVEMESPDKPGMYQGQWRMCSPTGTYCGDTIWVILQVDENGMLSLTQQMSSIPLGNARESRSSSTEFGLAKNPFAAGPTFPGNNSPNDQTDVGGWGTSNDTDMDGAWD